MATKTRCLYCGAEIDDMGGNNPFDGIHNNIRDKYGENGEVCCSKCNEIITWANRQFCKIIDNPEEIEVAIFELNELVKDITKNKQEIFQYYTEHKRDRENIKINIRREELGLPKQDW